MNSLQNKKRVSRKDAKTQRALREPVSVDARPSPEWRFAPENEDPARSARNNLEIAAVFAMRAEPLGVFASLRETLSASMQSTTAEDAR